MYLLLPLAFLTRSWRVAFNSWAVRLESFALRPRCSSSPRRKVFPFNARRTVVASGGATPRLDLWVANAARICIGVRPRPLNFCIRPNSVADRRGAIARCKPNAMPQRTGTETCALRERTASRRGQHLAEGSSFRRLRKNHLRNCPLKTGGTASLKISGFPNTCCAMANLTPVSAK